MNNVINAFFGTSGSFHSDSLFQWDQGQILKFNPNEVAEGAEVQFQDGFTKVIVNGQITIPNSLLEKPGKHTAWVQVIGDHDETTIKTIYLTVKPRQQKTDYIPEEDQDSFREDLQKILNESKSVAAEAKSVADSVRSDADAGKFDGKPGDDGKTPVKGTDYFTDADIQEVVDQTKAQIHVPSKTSELVNDSGFLTEHQDLSGKQDVINDLDEIRSGAAKGATALQTEMDPTVPSWAKAAQKPSYTVAEVGALPDTTVIPSDEHIGSMIETAVSDKANKKDLDDVDRRLDRIEEGADKVDIFTLENATEGYYVSSSGVLTPNKDVGVTDYIDLNGFIGDITYYFATALTHQGAFYNSEKTFISGFYLSGIGEHDITIPANARYVRLDYVLAEKDKYYCYATNPYLQKIDTVKINGTALDKVDGAVDIPLATTGGNAGIVKIAYGQGFHINADGQLNSYNENPYIDRRLTGRPLSLEHLDYAMKAAMTDGKGAEWTADQQKAAWSRLGLFEDLKSQITFGTRFAGKFQMLSTNQTTFMRIGNLIFLNIACSCLEAVNSTDLDFLYQIPTAYAPKYNSVGLAYNSSAKISGFCYVRGGSGQIVVKTAGTYGLNHEVDIAMFWTI